MIFNPKSLVHHIKSFLARLLFYFKHKTDIKYAFGALMIAQVRIDPSELKSLPQGDFNQTSFANGLKIIFGILGGIAVLIVALAGFKYVVSQGEPQATAKAKNTIIDAMIGLVICIMAFAIVSFVFRNI